MFALDAGSLSSGSSGAEHLCSFNRPAFQGRFRLPTGNGPRRQSPRTPSPPPMHPRNFAFGAPLLVDLLALAVWLVLLGAPTLLIWLAVASARRHRAQQTELARSWAAHIRGDAPPDTGAGEWHIWPPRIPR